MTQEQTNAVRTRDKQVHSLMGVVAPREEYPLVADLFDRHLAEAEARGATEQRIRDAQECDAKLGLILDGPKGYYRLVNLDGSFLTEKGDIQPLYCRPFNMDHLKQQISQLSGDIVEFTTRVAHLEQALRCQLFWHEGHRRFLSWLPQSSDNQHLINEHFEQIEKIRTVLRRSA
ncbi:hypothetical protein [Gluconobacter kondonii]|uniref:hypothetical protein n=1 Tax=Gluconobacter kondonii TaxID=941463 RepID=UPI001B8CC796|nr:hypothetical protein [Gluconobacter kondonii]MBS1081402.1 hypothetical protein [Gluconobacter kondonii]